MVGGSRGVGGSSAGISVGVEEHQASGVRRTYGIAGRTEGATGRRDRAASVWSVWVQRSGRGLPAVQAGRAGRIEREEECGSSEVGACGKRNEAVSAERGDAGGGRRRAGRDLYRRRGNSGELCRDKGERGAERNGVCSRSICR